MENTEYVREHAPLLGKRVRVTLDDKEKIVVEGIFLAFSDFGEVRIKTDDYNVHYCWPMLKVEEVKQ